MSKYHERLKQTFHEIASSEDPTAAAAGRALTALYDAVEQFMKDEASGETEHRDRMLGLAFAFGVMAVGAVNGGGYAHPNKVSRRVKAAFCDAVDRYLVHHEKETLQ